MSDVTSYINSSMTLRDDVVYVLHGGRRSGPASIADGAVTAAKLWAQPL